jgi:hypothetical protein
VSSEGLRHHCVLQNVATGEKWPRRGGWLRVEAIRKASSEERALAYNRITPDPAALFPFGHFPDF